MTAAGQTAEITRRLRNHEVTLMHEAADTIDALRRDVGEMREALAGVVAEADRETIPFIKARAILARLTGEDGQ